MVHCNRRFLIGLSLWCLSACATVESPVTESKGADVEKTLKLRTILPPKFGKGVALNTIAIDVLKIPSKLMRSAKIVRPQAELRRGPGSQFPLDDEFLVKGKRIFVFDDLGVWRKVIVDGGDVSGWVHYQTIDEERDSGEIYELPKEKLPTIIVLKAIDKVQAYPGLESIQVEIPRGAIFYSLMKKRGRRLVWISETNSVMWVPERNVR